MATKSTKWSSGPPPHIGWWNASTKMIGDVFRWWDGSRWSMAAWKWEDEFCASHWASIESICDSTSIMWSYYWPRNARVPRINPITGEVTGGAR